MVDAIDKVKQSAVGTARMFIVEVMGRECGYLRFLLLLLLLLHTFTLCLLLLPTNSMMGALCSGAERVLLPERKPSLASVEADLAAVKARFDDARLNSKVVRAQILFSFL
jgi:6-phosphofructokinase 1